MIKKRILSSYLKLKGNSFDVQYNSIKFVNDAADEDVLMENYSNYLNNILLHANKNVPFYTKRFEKVGILNSNDITLHEF